MDIYTSHYRPGEDIYAYIRQMQMPPKYHPFSVHIPDAVYDNDKSR